MKENRNNFNRRSMLQVEMRSNSDKCKIYSAVEQTLTKSIY